MTSVQLTFLGTGNCAGVPAFNCLCRACAASRADSNLRRRPCCALLEFPGHRILIDAGIPDLTGLFDNSQLDAILLTHYHIDHVQGLFPMRWGYAETVIPVYGPDYPEGCADLLTHPGIFDFRTTLTPLTPMDISPLTITPLPLNHSKPSLGYAIETAGFRLAWLCDTAGLPDPTQTFLQAWQPTITVLDCTFPPRDTAHRNHNDILRAIQIHHQTGGKSCYLTHIGHELDLWLMENMFALPPDIHIARDGLTLTHQAGSPTVSAS